MDKQLTEFIDDFERRLILYGVERVTVVIEIDGEIYRTEREHDFDG